MHYTSIIFPFLFAKDSHEIIIINWIAFFRSPLRAQQFFISLKGNNMLKQVLFILCHNCAISNILRDFHLPSSRAILFRMRVAQWDSRAFNQQILARERALGHFGRIRFVFCYVLQQSAHQNCSSVLIRSHSDISPFSLDLRPIFNWISLAFVWYLPRNEILNSHTDDRHWVNWRI